MNLRWEVSEEQWVEQFADLDESLVHYVRLDLADPAGRPWLDAARDRVEIIGRCPAPATAADLDRALELDVDFLCLGSGPGELDVRRLPLRLMVEDPDPTALDSPLHFGAAWARRLRDFERAATDRLAHAARRERLFLLCADSLPGVDLLERVEPFAVAVPAATGPEVLRGFGAE